MPIIFDSLEYPEINGIHYFLIIREIAEVMDFFSRSHHDGSPPDACFRLLFAGDHPFCSVLPAWLPIKRRTVFRFCLALP